MQRAARKSIYGLIYILILGFLGLGIYTKYLGPPAPTCQDGILNQDEEDIDCGGVACQSCELKNLELEIGEINVVETGENIVTLLIPFTNPSDNYGALNIPYTLSYSDSNSIPRTIEGKFSVDPGEVGYISEPGVRVSPFGAAASLKLGEFEFTKAKDIPTYQVGIRNLQVNTLDEGIEISGVLINDSPSPIRQIKVLAVLKNTAGEVVHAGETLLDNLGAFDRRSVVIRVPHKDAFIDLNMTEVFYEVIN